MRSCVDVDSQGYLHITSAEIGSSTCTYVITDSEELSFYPFNISSQDGIMIAGAIVSLWAVGFIVRLILKLMIYQKR